MKFLDRWWWPAFIFVYALWVFPIPGLSAGGYPSKLVIGTVWLIVGLLLEWVSHPHLRLQDLKHLPLALKKHAPVAVALMFGAWTLIASLFSNYPGISFLGSLADSSDGAIWNAALMLIFCCVYVHCMRNPLLVRRLIGSLILTGCVLFGLAIVEFIFKKGFFYSDIRPSDLPLVSFYGKGHLMGIMAMSTAVALALWFRGQRWMILVVFGFMTLIALGFHRAPWLAVLAVIPLGMWRTRAWIPGLVAGVVIGVSIFLGTQIGTNAKTGVARDIRSEASLQSRSILWKAAFRGILARPLTGWGGGHFQHYFFQYLTDQELKDGFRIELGYKYRTVLGAGKVNPLFAVTTKDGQRITLSISLWKAHNQILDVGVMWGIPGIIFYIILVFFGIRGSLNLDPLSIGVLVYQIFLLTWFIPPDAEGMVFAIWGAAAATNVIEKRLSP